MVTVGGLRYFSKPSSFRQCKSSTQILRRPCSSSPQRSPQGASSCQRRQARILGQSQDKEKMFSLKRKLRKLEDEGVEVATTLPSSSSVANPLVLTTAVTLFSLITYDVFGGQQWLVSHIDMPAHQWVSTSIDPDTRRFAAGWLLSDSWIAAGVAGWWVCGFTLVVQSGKKGLYLLGTSLGAYFLGGGFLLSGDVLLVDFIKHVVQRVRPSTLHRTFSFPSGHTTAGVFIVGVLLFVLLPQCLRPQVRTVEQRPTPQWVRNALFNLAQFTSLGRYPIWLAAGLTTATGRVLADAHWISDTLAGAFLGIALTSLTAMASKQRT